jgi:hypothetical protein
VNIKIMVFCDVTPYNVVDRCQDFGGTRWLHLHGRRYGYFSTETGPNILFGKKSSLKTKFMQKFSNLIFSK